jgi:hypothetical protein
MAEPADWSSSRPEALIDVLDRLLDTGAVLDGHIVLSVAGVDLVHLGLRALLASVDSAARLLAPALPSSHAPAARPAHSQARP